MSGDLSCRYIQFKLACKIKFCKQDSLEQYLLYVLGRLNYVVWSYFTESLKCA